MVRTIRTMAACLEHRGPDDQGYHVGGNIALGHRRLSIIDLKTGSQPIFNEDKSKCIIFNGEIYNYEEIKSELLRKGHRFASASDTETIIHAYEEWGEECVKKLRGMFSFCIWDSQKETLFLVRDRLGEKPLFHAYYNGSFVFSSEMKSILSDPRFDRAIDEEALGAYFTFSYIPAPLTIYKNIKKLSPGHMLLYKKGQVRIQQYWDVSFEPDRQKTETRFIQEFMDLLNESVRLQLRSDVPLGAFLSGGIDSSAIVAAMARMTDQPVKTYSIGFEGEDSFYNELPYASIVARAFGTDHHEIVVRPDAAELLPKLIWHMDEPIADSAFITTYLVSRLAAQSVKVILSGVGGDELFGGYRRYLGDAFSRYYRLLPRRLRQNWLPSILAKLPRDRHSSWKNLFRYAEAFAKSANLSPSERYLSYVTLFTADAAAELWNHGSNGVRPTSAAMQFYFTRCTGAENLNQCIYVDLKTSLADDLLALTDKMTMAMSLECRAPFMDHELVELAARMPANLKVRGFTMKYVLKKAVQPWLPAEILNRKKRGFGAPMGAWLRRDLKLLVQETLSERQVKKRGLFQWPVVKQLIQRHDSQEGDYTDHLLALINLELWFRQFMDQSVYLQDRVSVAPL